MKADEGEWKLIGVNEGRWRRMNEANEWRWKRMKTNDGKRKKMEENESYSEAYTVWNNLGFWETAHLPHP